MSLPLPKRTKTFTGCWTCRSRKLKCDEGRPGCKQCGIKNLTCEGYGTRLQWLPPETGHSSLNGTNTNATLVRTTISSRRQMLAAPTISVLGNAEIDRALSFIDNHQWLDRDEGTATTVRGPFAVFRGRHVVSTSPPRGSLSSASVSESLLTSDVDRESDFMDTRLDPELLQDYLSPGIFDEYLEHARSQEPSQGWCSPGSKLDLAIPRGPFSPLLGYSPHKSPSILSGFSISNDTPFVIEKSLAENLNWPAPEPLPLLQDDEDDEDPLSLSFYQPRSTSMSHDNRFLLQHYMHRVVKLFCVIDNIKSPWRSFHLPRALQSVGELGAFDETPNARHALLHALLSTSAYSLANNLKLEGRNSAEEWSRKALQLRYKAIRFLKLSVEHDLHSRAKPKYKELLAAMLSMISIDCVSGDTATCGLHLNGCEQLIRSARKSKTKYSPKARALHRIFFYLRTIHASTTLEKQGLKHACDRAEGLPLPEENRYEDATKDDNDWLDMQESSETDMTSCEYIYGVPQNLLVLMRKTIRIVQLVSRFRQQNPGSVYSTKLAEICDDIDEEILDWPVDAELSKCSSELRGDGASKIIEHQTRAFHHAIILYFSQHVRLIHHRHLRPYVESVLGHLEAIERIKDEYKVYAGPLFWPAFISASEAFDAGLQDRFKAWFARTKFYGFQAGWGGNDIAVEVWNKESHTKTRVTSQWRAVAEERHAELMLT